MNEIARFTTPAITFKPSAVGVGDIDEIYLVIKQYGIEVLRKDKDDASRNENSFTWFFTQSDTSQLSSTVPSVVQIDYLTGATRYTTKPRMRKKTSGRHWPKREKTAASVSAARCTLPVRSGI